MWPKCGVGHRKTGTRPLVDGSRAEPGQSVKSGKNRRLFSMIHRAAFGRQTVDKAQTRRLYTPSWRAAALRDGASAKPLTVYTVNHPAMSYGYVGCAGIGGSGASRRRGRKAPGCLKSESEERETWTAESLRAASAIGETLSRIWPWKRLRRSNVSRFSTLLTVQTVRRVGTSSNV
jgi:hypothetical protein